MGCCSRTVETTAGPRVPAATGTFIPRGLNGWHQRRFGIERPLTIEAEQQQPSTTPLGAEAIPDHASLSLSGLIRSDSKHPGCVCFIGSFCYLSGLVFSHWSCMLPIRHQMGQRCPHAQRACVEVPWERRKGTLNLRYIAENSDALPVALTAVCRSSPAFNASI